MNEVKIFREIKKSVSVKNAYHLCVCVCVCVCVRVCSATKLANLPVPAERLTRAPGSLRWPTEGEEQTARRGFQKSSRGRITRLEFARSAPSRLGVGGGVGWGGPCGLGASGELLLVLEVDERGLRRLLQLRELGHRRRQELHVTLVA